MITFKIDEFTPCLKDMETGDIVETEVIRIRRKSFLSKFNRNTGWYVNWGKFPSDVEVYALVIKGTVDIQGLIAVDYDTSSSALHLRWACVAPHNNIWEYGKKKYSGVGGHLFAIAAKLSIDAGFEGYMYGEPMDRELYNYYINEFNALPLPRLDNAYRIMINDKSSRKLMEVYTYEWTNDTL